MLQLFQILALVALLFASVHGAVQTNEADLKFNKMQYHNLTTNSYAEAIAYGRANPTRDGGSWAGWCAALMVRAGNLPDWAVRPSAIEAYRSSSVVSGDFYAAPSGAFHWWDVGEDGHVAMATDNGWGMMASCRVGEFGESWGDCIGNTNLPVYTAHVTGMTYLGWSYDYAGARLAGV